MRGVTLTFSVFFFCAFTSAQTKADQTQYCRVLFGPSGGMQIVVAFEADRLLVYPGSSVHEQPETYDFEEQRLLESEIQVVNAVDGRTYTITGVNRYLTRAGQSRASINVQLDGRPMHRQYCGVDLSEVLEDAKIAHFDGPLSIGPVLPNWKENGWYTDYHSEVHFQAIVGTIDDSKGCWTVVRSHMGDRSAFAPGVHPIVNIEYEGPHGPVYQHVELTKFC